MTLRPRCNGLAARASTRNLLLRWCGWLLLSTIAFELVIAARYFGVADVDQGPASLVFRAAMLLAHFTVLSAVLLAVVPVLSLLRAPVWLVVPLGTSLSIATLFALLIDTQVYQLYRFHIDAGVMNLLLGGAAHETFDFSGSMYLQAAAIAVAIILVQSVTAWLCWRYVLHYPASRRVARTLTATLLGGVVIFHVVHMWADATANEPLLEQTHVLPLRYAATAKRSLRALGFDVRSRPVAIRFSRTGSWRSCLSLVSAEVPAVGHAAQHHRDSHRLVAPRCTECASDAESRSVRAPHRALHGSPQRWQRHAHRRVLAFLCHPGHVLAPHAGRATGAGVHHRSFWSAATTCARFAARPCSVRSSIEPCSQTSTGYACIRMARIPPSAIAISRAISCRSSRRARMHTPFFALLFYDSPHQLVVAARLPQVFRPSAAEVNYLGLDAATDPLPLLNRYRNSTHYVDSLDRRGAGCSQGARAAGKICDRHHGRSWAGVQ